MNNVNFNLSACFFVMVDLKYGGFFFGKKENIANQNNSAENVEWKDNNILSGGSSLTTSRLPSSPPKIN